jgi:O-antigen/teichoic acid export membrane protein
MTTALAVLFSSALGRTLGASDFGLYFLIGSFSTLAYVLVDWGQQTYIIREVASRPARGSFLLGTALVLRGAGAVLAIVPSGLAAWALGYDATTCWYTIVFIAVSLPFFLAQTYALVFRARDRMGLDALVSVANKFALLGLALYALALGRGLPGVLEAQALAGILALAMAIYLYRRMTTRPPRYSSAIAHQILMGGTAIFTTNVLINLQPYIDLVLLSTFAPADVIGWYGAAKTVIGTIITPAVIIGAASFPYLSRTADSRGLFKAQFQASLRPMLWLGALAATGTFLFADDAIAILYGQQQFAPSAIVLKVYAPVFLLLFANILFAQVLFALDRAKAAAVVKMASVVVSTALALAAIPIFQQRTGNGGIGAVTAFVASEFVVSAGVMFLLRREGCGLNILVDFARALGSAALTLLLFWLMPPLPFFMRVPLCVLVFLLCSAGFGLVRRADVQLFWALLRKERQSEPQTSTRSE